MFYKQFNFFSSSFPNFTYTDRDNELKDKYRMETSNFKYEFVKRMYRHMLLFAYFPRPTGCLRDLPNIL